MSSSVVLSLAGRRLLHAGASSSGCAALASSRLRSFTAPARSLSSSAARLNPGLTSKGINEVSDKGAEGLHRADAAAVKSVKHDEKSHSDVPVMTGDWVLFHPVYSTSELKSVEVCLFFKSSFHKFPGLNATQVLHREPRNISDRLANIMVYVLR